MIKVGNRPFTSIATPTSTKLPPASHGTSTFLPSILHAIFPMVVKTWLAMSCHVSSHDYVSQVLVRTLTPKSCQSDVKWTNASVCDRGKWMNGGQTCIAPDYVLIDEPIKARFLELIKAKLKQFYGDDPSTCKDYERIVSDRHVARLAGLLRNQNIYCGTSRL